MNRNTLALEFFKCIIQADWNMPIPEGKTWDQIAIERAFTMADLFLKESEIITFG